MTISCKDMKTFYSFNFNINFAVIRFTLIFFIYFSIMILRIFGLIVSGIISLVIYFEVSNFKFSSDEPNKDRLLIDLVSYVLDRLHYNPKIINDDFSLKVFDDFIDAVDSQKITF